jgi:hypothetical protein
MDVEYTALMKNKTWHLVPPQKGLNVIGCKWVYKIKRKANGSIDTYKARLVAIGFQQRYGIDYENTFSRLLNLPLYMSFYLLLCLEDGAFDNLMCRMHFFMGSYKKKCTCNNLQVLKTPTNQNISTN